MLERGAELTLLCTGAVHELTGRAPRGLAEALGADPAVAGHVVRA